MQIDHQISFKANRVFNVIILCLLLILIRIWYLSIIQHDYHLAESRKPQRRTVIQHVERATIRDRFNIPLALNKIQYNASVCYAQIRQIPSIAWKTDSSGKQVRVQARAVYISELSKILAQELDLDPLVIEDTIHAKASLFPHTPFVLKEEISEKQYYRLKMLEKDWLGMQAQRLSKRFYPHDKVGCDVIGYMSSISSKEHERIAQEIKELQTYINMREAGELAILPKGFDNPIDVRKRLKELQEKAYTIHALIGKAGIESAFDEELRGYYGKKIFEVDVKGNFLRELPGSRKAVSGRRVVLTLSSELQEFAETLLAQYETLHENRDKEGKKHLDAPWIKGGAIVAMLPKTGEVVALASYPRFDPNDFIPTRDLSARRQKQSSILHWLENEAYVAEIWDGKRYLEKESFAKGAYFVDSLPLSWERYLETIFPKMSSSHIAMSKIHTIQTAVKLQQAMEILLALSSQNDMRALMQALYSENPHISSRGPASEEEIKAIQMKLSSHGAEYVEHKKSIDKIFASVPHNEDKLLILDLCRMLINKEEFSSELLKQIGDQSLSTFRSLCQAINGVQMTLKGGIQEIYHTADFLKWRQTHFKDFIKEKRKEEKTKKLYTRPYTDYLDNQEKAFFQEFWHAHRWALLETFLLGKPSPILSQQPSLQPYIAYLIQIREEFFKTQPALETLKKTLSMLPNDLSLNYLKTMRCFEELTRPLWGKYRALRNIQGKHLEKHLAAAFYPVSGFAYARSQAFRQSTPQGSVFKLVTAYEALKERYELLVENKKSLNQLNPLTLVDDLKWEAKKNSNAQILGFTIDGTPITRLYKGGRLPRSSHANIGKVDLIGALEQSSNIYFAILASEHIRDPMQLSRTARLFGFGKPTGIELPGEISGTIPDDLSYNKTGLYSFAIGQHSLVVTPLQTAAMLGAIANQGKLMQPKIVQVVAGKEPTRDTSFLETPQDFAFKEDLSFIGISFPLFTETGPKEQHPYVCYTPVEVKESLFFPDQIHHLLMEGMHRVVAGPKGNARPSAIRRLYENPKMIKDYVDLQNQIVGKTGTAEILYKHTIDKGTPAVMTTHVWFTGISYPTDALLKKEPWKDPELVVVVYLRFGTHGGKEAAPLVAQMVKKWREICARHDLPTH